jgi:hypothetical protein
VLFNQSDDGQSDRMALVEFAPCSDWSQASTYHKGDCVRQLANAPAGSFVYFICVTTNTAGISGVTSQPPKTQADLPPNWRWVGGPPLQLRAGTDVETLPVGVSAQTVCDGSINNTGTTRLTDGYLSTGLILFDGNGRLSSQLYAVPDMGPLADVLGIVPLPNQHLGYPSALGVYLPGSTPAALGVMSQYGLVLYQREQFLGQGLTFGDVLYTTSNKPTGAAPPTNASWITAYTNAPSGPSEQLEEQWLDQNATPLLINRYNGTLVRGE